MHSRPFVSALAIACACFAHAPSAHASFASPPPLLQGDESVASVDDARALLLNPAAIGLRYPFELADVWRRRDADFQSNSLLLTSGQGGLYWLHENDSTQVWGLGSGFGSDPLRLGWNAYRVVSSGQGGSITDYNAGLLARPAPWLALGASADHVFQPTFRGQRRLREYTLGVGLRPLALARASAYRHGPRLTLTADMRFADGDGFDEARSWVGAELEPVPGVAIKASLGDHGQTRFGVMLLGTRMRMHSAGATARKAWLERTYGISVHKGEERSLFASRAEHRVAVVRAGGVLADEATGGGALGGASTTPTRPLSEQLERAAEDPLTRGVLLELNGVGGMAQLEELRPRLERLRSLGKPVVAYMEEGGGRGDLYLASACDRIVASEEAIFMSLGLRTERRYWREALGRAGVRIERSSTGVYKSAFRNLSVDAMPAADSAVVQRDLDERQRLFVDAVSAGRRVPAERLLPYLDGREWCTADLCAGGVLDSMGYREDAMRILGRLAGLGEKPRAVNLRRVPPARRAWTMPTRLAVVYASGGIETGRSSNNLLTGATLGSTTLIGQLEKAFHASGVKAVVFRIESPGGSALASDLIDHAVRRLIKETKKPLIVSMGSVAASGGYYIACHADRIFADHHTRTGSIGVLTLRPSFEGMYAKLKAKQAEFDRGDYMRGSSWSRDWTEREQAAADSTILRLYRGFVGKVAEGRRMTTSAVHEVAQGRVWLGEDARARGLVDEIGGLETALAAARARVGIPQDEKIAVYEVGRPRGSWFERLVGGWIRETLAREARLPDFAHAQMIDEEVLAPIVE